MKRRSFFTAMLAAAVAVAAPEKTSVRGTLTTGPQGRPALKTKSGMVTLTGDEPSLLVLRDKRLAGADFEVAGHFTSPAEFEIAPSHTHPLFVYRNGKKMAVSYWCDICYIRTWSPGKCVCCQEETKLDPVDPDTLDSK